MGSGADFWLFWIWQFVKTMHQFQAISLLTRNDTKRLGCIRQQRSPVKRWYRIWLLGALYLTFWHVNCLFDISYLDCGWPKPDINHVKHWRMILVFISIGRLVVWIGKDLDTFKSYFWLKLKTVSISGLKIPACIVICMTSVTISTGLRWILLIQTNPPKPCYEWFNVKNG